MQKELFFRNKNMSITLEDSLPMYDSLEKAKKYMVRMEEKRNK